MKKRLLSTLLGLCVVLALFPTVFAADSDFVVLNCTEANKYLGYTKYGGEDNYGILMEYNGPGGAITIPNSVYAIDQNAFRNNRSLTSVVIPNSISVTVDGKAVA